MKDKTKYAIEGCPGEWTMKHSWISELGYVMVSFWNEEDQVTMSVNTQTTLEQALQLPWAHAAEPEGTNTPDISIIY